ncbi:hypothetical protein GSI_09556 [Ganoderma sinense ZZ0214-1]|uniref:Uncharacterized protein n=1 Tax=Ganoderma sinense ZZ0214-1 TaxID=1077348 RepID=A0A2G8S3U1_9APHY|nr:hypothetical protein GSI_09556 [Ganoderma sinense ZZ0214-1]
MTTSPAVRGVVESAYCITGRRAGQRLNDGAGWKLEMDSDGAAPATSRHESSIILQEADGHGGDASKARRRCQRMRQPRRGVAPRPWPFRFGTCYAREPAGLAARMASRQMPLAFPGASVLLPGSSRASTLQHAPASSWNTNTAPSCCSARHTNGARYANVSLRGRGVAPNYGWKAIARRTSCPGRRNALRRAGRFLRMIIDADGVRDHAPSRISNPRHLPPCVLRSACRLLCDEECPLAHPNFCSCSRPASEGLPVCVPRPAFDTIGVSSSDSTYDRNLPFEMRTSESRGRAQVKHAGRAAGLRLLPAIPGTGRTQSLDQLKRVACELEADTAPATLNGECDSLLTRSNCNYEKLHMRADDSDEMTLAREGAASACF